MARIPATTRSFLVMGTLMWAAAPAPGQFGTELAPRELEAPGPGPLPFGRADLPESRRAGGGIIAARLDRIRLEGGAGRPQAMAEGVLMTALTVDGRDVLAGRLAEFLGKPLTTDGMDRIITVILRHYETHDRPVVDVWAPRQSLADGDLTLEVIEGTVGAIGIETVGIFDDRRLGRGIRLGHGDLLRSSDLQAHLDWFNRNPFRPAALYAAPGEFPGEADLIFSFASRRPWRIYAGYENTGAEVAGGNRYFAGLNWGNAFGLDQMLSYQFTVGDALDELQAHSLVWEIPLHPWHQFVRLRGGWAGLSTETRSRGVPVESDGTNWMLGASHGWQLPRRAGLRHEIMVGAEFKAADNFLVFGGTEQPGSVVEVLQFRADYLAERRFERGAIEFEASLVASPGGLTGRNNDEDFEAFRHGAGAAYLYGRARAVWVRQLPARWSLRLSGNLQLADDALLPTEQLGLGGYDAVRGYQERDYLADSGYALSAELRTPAYELPLPGSSGARLQLLAFLDHGRGWRDEAVDAVDSRRTFLGTGTGARLRIGDTLSARADLGIPLREARGPRAHVGVTLSY